MLYLLQITFHCLYQIKNLCYNKIKAFYSPIDDTSLQKSVAALLKTVGVGKIKPNILLMGFIGDWKTCDRDYLN